MKKFKVRYGDMFFEDLEMIVRYILEQSGSVETARRFYVNALNCIEKRSFGADSYEVFHPYKNAPDYYRLYFGNYTIFYVIENNAMNVRRILWSGKQETTGNDYT